MESNETKEADDWVKCSLMQYLVKEGTHASQNRGEQEHQPRSKEERILNVLFYTSLQERTSEDKASDR